MYTIARPLKASSSNSSFLSQRMYRSSNLFSNSVVYGDDFALFSELASASLVALASLLLGSAWGLNFNGAPKDTALELYWI